jgi:NAD(P)-dependent dehydrogenase (short-subunit alcohol dehydrogenase family)
MDPARDELPLAGRCALITGGASGIGRATALRYLRDGASVAVVDRDPAALDAIRDEARADGRLLALRADVTEEAEVERAVADAAEGLGGLDVLVANAAVQLFGRDAPVHELDREVWDTTIAVNLTGVFLTCKHGIRALLSRGGGSVIVTASPTALYGMAAGFDAYSASKGGALALARVMANDYAPHGIRVNAVVPGVTATPLIRDLTDDPVSLGSFVERIPLGRVGTADDVAGVMAFLASDDSAYATGAVFSVDGGITAV